MYQVQMRHRMKAKMLIQFQHTHPIFDPNFVLIRCGNRARILPKPRDSLFHQSRRLRRLLDVDLKLGEAILVLVLGQKMD